MAEKVPIAEFDLDTSNLKKSLSDLQDSYFDLRKEQKAYADQSKATAKEIDALTKKQELLTKASGDNSKAIEDNEKELQELLKTEKKLYKSEQDVAIQMGTVRKEINQTTTQLRAYQDAEGKTTSLIDLGNQALNRQIKNKNDARFANIALNNVANQLNPNIEEEAVLLKQLNAQMDKNTEFIKENASETAKQKMNIGNYQSALEGVDAVLAKFGVNGQQARTIVSGFTSTVSKASSDISNYTSSLVQSTASTLGFKTASQLASEAQAVQSTVTETQTVATTELAVATEATTVATTASTIGFKAFTIALASTGIGLIVIALGSLISYLTNTQSGIDKLNSVLEPLKALFTTLTSLASELGSKLVSAFDNPKKALSQLGDFVKQNLINRFTAFGVILDGIINLDFKKVANGVLQVGTGVQNVTGKIANIANATSKLFADSVAKGQQVASITRQINDLQLKYNANQVAVNDALDEQLLISKDTSKSFKERANAANQIIAISEKNGQAEKKILDLEMQRLKLQQSIKGAQNLTNEDKQAEIDLIAKIDEAEDRGLNARLEQTKVLSGLKKEQAEASKKADEEALNRLLQQSRDEIDLFIAKQGFAKKSAEEEYQFNKDLFDKEDKDIELRFKKGKLTQTQYETEKQSIKNEFARSNAELAIENADLELSIQLEKNKRILDNDKYLSDEQARIKQQALESDLQAQLNFEAVRLANKEISEAEYNKRVNEINETNRLANEKLANDRIVADQEKRLADLENQKTINEENFLAQAEIEKAQNEIKRQQEVANAEKTGADVSLINQKYAEANQQIDQTVLDKKLSATADMFGGIATILGENSKAGKAAAIAQATINTYQGVSAAWMAPAVLPQPFDAISKVVASGVALASGLKAVKEITSTKEPKFKKPSYASGVIGLRGAGSATSDNISSNLSVGESVINAKSTGMYANELSAINQAGGGVGINGASNILNQNQIDNNVNNTQMAQMIAEAVAVGAEAGTSKGSKNGIKSLSDDRKVMADAKF